MTSLDITNGVRTALTRLREAWEWYDAIPPVRKIHSALGQVADGWRRISRWLNSVMPKGLYARALLIIIAPMVILQSVVAFLFMEGVAWFTHKYVMHGFLWVWHRSHHTPRTGMFELNDLFADAT